MGVLGLTAVLIQEGFMPPKQGCSHHLWYEPSEEHDGHRVTIPRGSPLCVDGNGLAYWLYGVAYSRWYHRVVMGDDKHHRENAKAKDTTNKSNNEHHLVSTQYDCTCPQRQLQRLTAEQVTKLLPQHMPLDELHQVTTEFMTPILRAAYPVSIFWDGPGRRMKAGTTLKRFEQKSDEWNRLQQYCDYGVLPFQTSCQRQMLKHFPSSRLLVRQVYWTLSQMRVNSISAAGGSSSSGVSMIQCTEEADAEVARASLQMGGYVLGMDSDYCLFRDIRYCPLSSLQVLNSSLRAHCITRQVLASELELESDHLVVELGILAGNDFIENTRAAMLGFLPVNQNESVSEILEYIRQKPLDFQVYSESSDPDINTAIEFSRALYNLESLEDFPLDMEDDDDGDDNDDDELNNEDDFEGEEQLDENGHIRISTDRPSVPRELDLQLAIPNPLDHTFADVILRPLKAYVDGVVIGKEPKVLTGMHLSMFHMVASTEDNESSSRTFQRPKWEDVIAAYVIEKVVAVVLSTSQSAPVVKYQSPGKVWDVYRFHSLMAEYRKAMSPSSMDAISNIGSPTNGESMDIGLSPGDEDPPAPVVNDVLPIDEHKENILETIDRQRVTIIHGMTGCGKSSRVPVMILRAPPPSGFSGDVKMFISQPRRIAAKSLVERVRSCEPDLKSKIALRMGHGVREYESHHTRAWFVTTGYIVRLLANHPERFQDISHLIIDEVHERSVDTDILCLLCRRLLHQNDRIRLVLMSATMAADLYASYFDVREPPIEVGARRFPIKEYFVEDFTKNFRLSTADAKITKDIATTCNNGRCRAEPGNSYIEKLLKISVKLSTMVAQPGTSVLIFVPGMNEIVGIIDLLEKVHTPGIRYSTVPIHSDIPFEEQMTAFDAPSSNEVKIIVATNAAESSVTLPSVDHVICTGLCKQVVYNPMSHRQMLTPAWISRASATQRAGRTGRVRNGNVYRLYTNKAFTEYMDKFERGEILRTPLDSVILQLKEMLQEQATPILMECLEPPDIENIDRSFINLYQNEFIDQPDDTGEITRLGTFVSALGIDLALGSLIGLGIQNGVGAEVIEMAAVMSFPKSPWQIPNPLFQEPYEFNDMTTRAFQSKSHFDAKLYSEPLGAMNLMHDFEMASNQKEFCWSYSVSNQKLRRLLATRNSLRKRVADFLFIDPDKLKPRCPPSQMPQGKLLILRVIQVWVFNESMIETQVGCKPIDNYIPVILRGKPIQEEHLNQVIDPERHPYELVTNYEIEQKGDFTPVSDRRISFAEYIDSGFFDRFVSLALENGYGIFFFHHDKCCRLAVLRDVRQTTAFSAFSEDSLYMFTEEYIVAYKPSNASKRGRGERACGQWKTKSELDSDECDAIHLSLFSLDGSSGQLSNYMRKKGMQIEGVGAIMGCTFSRINKPSPAFSLNLIGNVAKLNKTDLSDLFATPNMKFRTTEKGKATQQVRFEQGHEDRRYRGQRGKHQTDSGKKLPKSSWNRPLLNDVPEGVRILSVLASTGSRRKFDHFISFDNGEDEETQVHTYTKVDLSKSETCISERWARRGEGKAVYVNECTVPAAAMSIDGDTVMYCCCANTMDLKGGGLRADTLTLMPPGRLFLLLAFLSFGMQPFIVMGDKENEDEFIDECLIWLQEDWESLGETIGEPVADILKRAMEFDRSCRNMGEDLICFPDKVKALLGVFQRVVPHLEEGVWRDLEQDPFIPRSEEELEQIEENSRSQAEVRNAKNRNKAKNDNKASSKPGKSKNGKAKAKVPKAAQMRLGKKNLKKLDRLFAINLDSGDRISDQELPTTNLLALVVKQFCQTVLDRDLMPEDRTVIEQAAMEDFNSNDWEVYSVNQNDENWVFADYVGSIVPYLPIKGRSKGNGGNKRKNKQPRLPDWIEQDLVRPSTRQDALSCIPEQFVPDIVCQEMRVEIEEGAEPEMVVAFPSIEVAVRMGAAYYLERQCNDGESHWYQIEFGEMMAKFTSFLVDK